MTNRIVPILTALACAGIWVMAGTAQAQVNKCIDTNGKTVYSQSPCPSSSKSSVVRQSVAPAPPAAASAASSASAAKSSAPKSAAELELDFRKRQTEQAEASKKAAEKVTEAQQREENCRQSRGTLAGLEEGRQSRINEKGERVFLNDAEVAAERSRAKTAVEQWCKSA
jgi:metal-dependent amidase/aminoacylase/carboxypeptidase family protein